MVNTDKIKEIVSHFLKVDPTTITDQTIIDNTAIRGSIMVHRMFDTVSAETNCKLTDTRNIKTYGQLLHRLDPDASATIQSTSTDQNTATTPTLNTPFAIGIDIEQIQNLPQTDDFREESFYTNTFSPTEISYCILQQEPITSFAGKFAAKEAIVKADNSYTNIPFNKIEILNDKQGKPYFRDFSISISHTNTYAVSIACKLPLTPTMPNTYNSKISLSTPPKNLSKTSNLTVSIKIAGLALLLSIISLGFILFDKIL